METREQIKAKQEEQEKKIIKEALSDDFKKVSSDLKAVLSHLKNFQGSKCTYDDEKHYTSLNTINNNVLTNPKKIYSVLKGKKDKSKLIITILGAINVALTIVVIILCL